MLHHLQNPSVAGFGAVSEEECIIERHRELRRISKPSPFDVVHFRQLASSGALRVFIRDGGAGRTPMIFFQGIQDRRAILSHLLRLKPPELGYPVQNGNDPRHPHARFFRKVGRREERLATRGHDDGERPAATSRHHLGNRHVLGIYIRALFTIHFHRHVVPVEHLCHLLVLEGLVSHNMAPVAGGIADGKEYRLVLEPCR